MKMISKKLLKKINIPKVLLWILLVLLAVIIIYNLGIYFKFYENFTMSLADPLYITQVEIVPVYEISTKHLRIGEIKINDVSNNYTIDTKFSSTPDSTHDFVKLHDSHSSTYYKSKDTPGKLRLTMNNNVKMEKITITNCLYNNNTHVDNLKKYKINFIDKYENVFTLLFTDTLCSDLFSGKKNYTLTIDLKAQILNQFKGKDGAPGKDGVNGKDGANGKDCANGKDGKDYVPILTSSAGIQGSSST